jgi:hypothetical protein
MVDLVHFSRFGMLYISRQSGNPDAQPFICEKNVVDVLDNWELALPKFRVTRSGEFSPIKRLFTLSSIFL